MKNFSLTSFGWRSYSLEEKKRVMKYHKHNSVEISYVRSGLLLFHYKNKGKEGTLEIPKGHVLLTFPNLIHKTEIPYSLSSLGIEFSPDNGDTMGSLKDEETEYFLKENQAKINHGFLVAPADTRLVYDLMQFEDFASRNVDDEYHKVQLKLLIKKVLIYLFRQTDTFHHQDANKNSYIKGATLFIEENFDRPITVTQIASQVNCSQSYLQKEFKDQLHIGVKQFVNQVRMEKAASLLKESGLSVINIAKAVGYQSVQIFIRNFEKAYQESPFSYRNHITLNQYQHFFKDNGYYQEEKFKE